jgi:uncharacterized membrane protein SpoIIM required for sporulation|tara:strand:+ start:850 stop:966 length:117 start_codon:yes stop_codon:yes gene_type:complete
MGNILELGAFFIFGGACFALGMYITTQISSWIDKKIKK